MPCSFATHTHSCATHTRTHTHNHCLAYPVVPVPPAACMGNPPNPEFGTFSCRKTPVGRTCTATCLGTQSIDRPTAVCTRTGTWSDVVGSCTCRSVAESGSACGPSAGNACCPRLGLGPECCSKWGESYSTHLALCSDCTVVGHNKGMHASVGWQQRHGGCPLATGTTLPMQAGSACGIVVPQRKSLTVRDFQEPLLSS